MTLEKLRFLLSRAVEAFGDYRLDELDPRARQTRNVTRAG